MFEHQEVPIQIDVPARTETINGREVTIAGSERADEGPATGRGNAYGYENTTSLAAGALYLRGVSEGDLVERSLALGMCNRVRDAAFSGGVSQDDLCRLLSESDTPHRLERAYSLEDLAQNIETGARVIAFLNAAELWDNVVDVSQIEGNYPVLMEAVARDAQTQEIAGFLIRDPAAPGRTAFVDAAKMERSWLETGGWQIVPSL